VNIHEKDENGHIISYSESKMTLNLKTMGKILKIEVPTSCSYNLRVGYRMDEKFQRLFGDTADTANWEEFSFPLPKLFFSKWVLIKNSPTYAGGVREITVERRLF
jgi:hypothetical protein